MRSAAAATAQAIAQVLTGVMAQDKGRLLAALAYRLGDIALAEEVLQEACLSALTHWGRSGLPHSPQGWLLKVALRRAIDRFRAQGRRQRHHQEMELLAQEEAADSAAPEIPDHRLRLMFACCHPALEPKTRVALTLRVVCGLTTPQVAAVFLDSEAAMGQRLSRAKGKIKAAGIGFAIPAREVWPERLQSVLTAIYLIYTRGYAAGPQMGHDLCHEALFLARLMGQLCPDEAEIQGALALLLFTEARAKARAAGQMIAQQNHADWDAAMQAEAEALLNAALARGPVGPFQIKAAIAACHMAQGGPDWPQIQALLARLTLFEDTPVVHLSQAVATAQVQGPAAALPLMQDLAADLAAYGPYHAARADVLARLGQIKAALAAYDQAIALAENAQDAAYLAQKRAALHASPSA
jgi:RNA polymerase sigma factor (sigma-70 family)